MRLRTRLGGVRCSRDVGAVGTPLAVAINYVTVRARDIRAFGVRTDSDWQRLEDLMARVLRLMQTAD